MGAVLESFARLADSYELILVEGAGSPAEINLRAGDIANMGFARRVGMPVCLVGDIDKGGVIASLVGTQALLDKDDAALIRGFVINKFRGDPTLFDDGIVAIESRTGWRSFGVIPWLPAAANLPAEDAVVLDRHRHDAGDGVKVVAPMLSRMANFDDADPLRMEPGVDFRWVPPGDPLPRDADVVILFGTKSTLGDLAFLRAQGWDHDILAHARAGGRVLGLCGGFQMLGRTSRMRKVRTDRPARPRGLACSTSIRTCRSPRPCIPFEGTVYGLFAGYGLRDSRRPHRRPRLHPPAVRLGRPDRRRPFPRRPDRGQLPARNVHRRRFSPGLAKASRGN